MINHEKLSQKLYCFNYDDISESYDKQRAYQGQSVELITVGILNLLIFETTVKCAKIQIIYDF